MCSRRIRRILNQEEAATDPRKYMKKSKTTADVAVAEVPPRSSNGVRTRAAKTLALQRLQRPSQSSSSPLCGSDVFSSSYLELRSRRLERFPLLKRQNVRLLFRRKKEGSGRCCGKRLKMSKFGSNSKLRFDSLKSESVCSGYEKDEEDVGFAVHVEDNRNLASIKPSFVDSDLELKEENWSTVGVSLPTSDELEEFFASAERKQQRLFIEKYNFDIVNDVPLPGRYEWAEVLP